MIISTSCIINEHGPKSNPRENEFYEYQTKFENPGDFCEHVKWSIIGDVPVGITIDAASGLISGKIEPFYNQPSCQDNYPYEECNFDGSNWQNDGRYKHKYYDFHFTIQRNILIKGSKGDCSSTEELIEINQVYIREVLCHNINNLLFIKRYLESNKTSIGGDSTSIIYKGISYSDYKELEKVHPGPFVCK